MKKFLIALSAFALILTSCTNDVAFDEAVTPTNSPNSAYAKNSPSDASTSKFTDYNIAVSVSSDGSVWTYTITKAKAGAKTLSHFIVNLNNCGEESATFSDVIYATVNGVPTDLSTSEGSGTGCSPTTTNFIKFPTFSAANEWILVIKFDRGYEKFEGAKAWIKAGSSCNEGLVAAPGCPKEVYCSFSQGYFFANGADNNGSSSLWVNGLTIGGITYTQAQGNTAWTDNNIKKQLLMNGFFQLGAVRLSGVESQVASDAALIEAYFQGINILNLSKTKLLPASVITPLGITITQDQVKAAGSAIGTYIDAHHCE